MLTAALAVMISTVAFAAEAAKSFGICPIGGKPAKESVSIDYKGKKIYFCCAGCEEPIKEHPEKYTAKLNNQLAVTGQITQVACPFSGGPVKDGTAVEVGGVKVGFCCEKCQKKVTAATDDEAKVDMVFAKIDKGFTMQEKCPISGKPINPEMKTEYKGKTVYFCCGGCPKAFEADPEKYAVKLPKE